jgi:hypothetical protein
MYQLEKTAPEELWKARVSLKNIRDQLGMPKERLLAMARANPGQSIGYYVYCKHKKG